MRSLIYEETHSSSRKGRPMRDLEEFYNAHYSGLYAYCVTLTRNRADAEDLAAFATLEDPSFPPIFDHFDLGTVKWLLGVLVRQQQLGGATLY